MSEELRIKSEEYWRNGFPPAREWQKHKNPPCVIENSRGILEDFYKISTQQYHTVRWGHDAKMIYWDWTYSEYMESAEDVKLFKKMFMT